MHFDAIILGYGPVGAVAVNMLAQRGWNVAVIDRLPEPYPLPRAIGFDGETARTFQEMGIIKEIEATTTPTHGAEFLNAKGERMIGIDLPPGTVDLSRYAVMNFFHQPTLENVLRTKADDYDNVSVFLEHEAAMPTQTDDGVQLDIKDIKSGETKSLSASYLIAADGASSPVRKGLGFKFDSLGYDCQWLVVDVSVKDRSGLPALVQQHCDPDRVITFVPGVNDLARWEIRANEGETEEEMLDDDFIWSIIGRWTTKDKASLIRKAVYQFHAATANQWAEGRIFLAGDAAHQTPPFLGQGMVAGIRDVCNLVWKLDLVKQGFAPSSLLESYEPERKPHALDVVAWAVETGKLMDAIAEAHHTGNYPEDMSAAYGGSRGMPRLHCGMLAVEDGEEPEGLIGNLAPQALVSMNREIPVLSDELIGPNFGIISEHDVSGDLSENQKTFLDSIGATILHLPKDARKSEELDLLLALNRAIIIRPDRYIFGFANQDHSLSEQVDKLRTFFN